MDDYDAYLYSIDDPELFEEGESDNDILDNIDEEQVHTDTTVVLVPASSPMREREAGDEKEPEPNSTVAKLITKYNRSVDTSSCLIAQTSCIQSVNGECVSRIEHVALLYLSNQNSGSQDTKGNRRRLSRPLSQVSVLQHPADRTWMNAPLRRRCLRSRPDRHGKGQFLVGVNELPYIL